MRRVVRLWDFSPVRQRYVEQRVLSEADIRRSPEMHSIRAGAGPVADWQVKAAILRKLPYPSGSDGCQMTTRLRCSPIKVATGSSAKPSTRSAHALLSATRHIPAARRAGSCRSPTRGMTARHRRVRNHHARASLQPGVPVSTGSGAIIVDKRTITRPWKSSEARRAPNLL